MSYEVKRYKNGREYRYLQSTFRDENGVVHTVYEGMIDGNGVFVPKKQRRKGIAGFIDELIEERQTRHYRETEEEVQARVARQNVEYARRDHVNDLLTAPTITLESIREIAAMQAEDAAKKAGIEPPQGKEMFWTDPIVPIERSEVFGPLPDAPNEPETLPGASPEAASDTAPAEPSGSAGPSVSAGAAEGEPN